MRVRFVWFNFPLEQHNWDILLSFEYWLLNFEKVFNNETNYLLWLLLSGKCARAIYRTGDLAFVYSYIVLQLLLLCFKYLFWQCVSGFNYKICCFRYFFTKKEIYILLSVCVTHRNWSSFSKFPLMEENSENEANEIGSLF